MLKSEIDVRLKELEETRITRLVSYREYKIDNYSVMSFDHAVRIQCENHQ